MDEPFVYEAKEPSLEYLAGFFDGEGCISIGRHASRGYASFTLHCNICQQNKYLPDIFQAHFGGKVIRYPNKWEVNNYQWIIGGKNASDFLTMLLPFLILKEDEAKLAKEFQSKKRKKGGWPPMTRKEIEEQTSMWKLMHQLKDHSDW